MIIIIQQQKVNQKIIEINNDFLLNIKHSPTLNKLLQKIKIKDRYTYQHSFNVYMYSIAIGKKLGFKHNDLQRLGRGALLHDIGKLDISDMILKKPTKLTELEYKKIKKHPLYGIKVLSNNNILNDLKLSILEHHENFDGSGYPFGLSKEEISLHARIIRVADSFDTITSTRVYQKKRSIKTGLDELKAYSGKHFDPNIVNSFVNIINN